MMKISTAGLILLIIFTNDRFPYPVGAFNGVCGENEFRCPDDQCISLRMRCDGIDQCRGGLDEEECQCLRGEVTCRDGTCIQRRRRCDGRYDCSDGTDELNCYALPCSTDQFTCQDGTCVDASLRCNRQQDCHDESDEDSCDNETGKVSLLHILVPCVVVASIVVVIIIVGIVVICCRRGSSKSIPPAAGPGADVHQSTNEEKSCQPQQPRRALMPPRRSDSDYVNLPNGEFRKERMERPTDPFRYDQLRVQVCPFGGRDNYGMSR